MKPQWYKNLPNSWQDFVDQVLHAALGYAIAWATGYWIASVAVAILREFFQNWWDEKNDRGDMALDIFVWTLGASLVF